MLSPWAHAARGLQLTFSSHMCPGPRVDGPGHNVVFGSTCCEIPVKVVRALAKCGRSPQRPARPDHPPAHRSLFRTPPFQVPGPDPPMPDVVNRQHLLQDSAGELAAVLDFGDASSVLPPGTSRCCSGTTGRRHRRHCCPPSARRGHQLGGPLPGGCRRPLQARQGLG